MTKLFLLTFGILFGVAIQVSAQKEVPQSVMQQIYNEVKTSFKYGLILAPTDESKKWFVLPFFETGTVG